MATIKDLKRMCNSYKECDDCPLSYTRCGDRISALYDNADEIVANGYAHILGGIHND